MTCFHPLTGYRALTPNPDTGKCGIVFNPSKSLIGVSSPIKLPCGQCSGCRAERAHQWAVRCGHESRSFDSSCFITLSYNDESVPSDFSVKMRHWQLFMMRLRKRFGSGIRFFGCGEYGDQSLRPHYHALLFNFDFADKRYRTERNGNRVFTSEALSELWPDGFHEIGSVTNASAGYVARYCLKKINGKRADDHYYRPSPVDGQMHRVEPEFATMSRRPGLGTNWFDNFAAETFPSDFLIVDGRKVRPPAYYLRRLDESGQEKIKRARKRAAVKPEARWNSTPERLAVREEVHAARIKRLVRTL